jgi:hypothetical protein
MYHTLTYATDSIVTGNVYTFRFKAINSKGNSTYSELLSVACNAPPPKAPTPIVNYSYSSRTSIFISWNLTQDGIGSGGKITGNRLYMDNGRGGDFNLILDTVGQSS